MEVNLTLEIARVEHELEALREEGRRSPERFAYLQPARERLQRRLRFLRRQLLDEQVATAESDAGRVTLAEIWSASWPAGAVVLCMIGIGVLLAFRG